MYTHDTYIHIYIYIYICIGLGGSAGGRNSPAISGPETGKLNYTYKPVVTYDPHSLGPPYRSVFYVGLGSRVGDSLL